MPGGLTTALEGALGQVSPSPAFREGLARDLAAHALQKKSPQIVLQRPRHRYRQLIIGAAVSSAVSVAGLIALIWHHRTQRVANHAS